MTSYIYHVEKSLKFITPKHGINDLTILLLIPKPSHILMCDM